MKTEKWMPLAAFAALLVTTTSCEDWGKQDPPAGNQVYPTLQNVAKYDFQAEEGLDPAVYRLVANPGGEMPAVVEDEEKGKVLGVNNGSLAVSNPLTAVVLQDAASLTFWLKVDGVESLSQPLISFEDESGSAGVSVAADGSIRYAAADGNWSTAGKLADYVTPGEWHYMAMVLSNTGYTMTVDGENTVNEVVTDFDCSKMVSVANAMPDLKIGSASNATPFYVDDLTVYRNTITEKQTARPELSGGGGGMANFEYVVGDPIFNIGNPDCSAGWWTEFSNYYRIPANTTMSFRFINHTSGGGNWNNWNLCVSTDVERGGDGYLEYFVIRSDLYGWGSTYNGDNWSNEGYGDWDKFRVDMEGAVVVVTIERKGDTTYVTAEATCKDGTVYIEKFFASTGDENDVVRAFFIVDGSYLEFDKDGCMVQTAVPITVAEIGAEDCSAGWWTEFSDYFSIPANMSLHLGFKNFTSGGGNWNNWNLCVSTDAERGGDGYLEYFVIRSDLYGWGATYNGDNWTNEGYGDWDKFRVDMNGAYVDLDIVRQDATTYVTAEAACPDGTHYIERFNAPCGEADEVLRAFLIVDGSHLKMNASDCYLHTPIYK